MRPLLATSLVLSTLTLCAANTPAPALPEADDQPVLAPAAPATNPAADAYWRAMKLLRDGKSADWPQVRAFLKQATDAEYPPALNFVALCHLNKQYGYKKDPGRAANLLRLSAEQHNATACLLLGRCYLFGTGVRKESTQAAVWFNAVLADSADFSVPTPPADYVTSPGAATTLPNTLSGGGPVDPADQLRASAHLFLGQICADGKKETEAQDHFVKAATQGANHSAGVYEAAIMAAINYAFGQGAPRDMAKADEMLALSKTLARRNVLLVTSNLVEQKLVDDFAQADVEEEATAETDKIETQLQFAIAGSFADPKSKEYDPKEAAEWYELAAEKNEAWAMLSLAFLYHEGRLGTPDPVKAFEWFKQAAERGNHTLGWSNLSICYEQGFGTAIDHAKAAELWQENRDHDIICYLGTIGQCPTTIQTYEQQLELTKIWAEKKQDAQAQYLLAMRYLHGSGVEQERKTAVHWLKKAAKANHGRALHQLGLLYRNWWQELGLSDHEKANKKAFECFEKSASAGFADGYFQVGYSFHEGLGCLADQSKAIDAYTKALALNPKSSASLNNLGSIYKQQCMDTSHRSGSAYERSHQQMLEAYYKADELKCDYAAFNLGLLAYDGILVPKDLSAAYSYFETAAARGYPAAKVHFRLGQMLEKGEGVPYSLKEAAFHYRLATLDGSEDALIKLCDIYTTRPGFVQNHERAIYWLSRLAQRGNMGAMVTIGDTLIRKGDYAEAFRFFRPGIELEQPAYLRGCAYDRLARLYRDGLGTKANPKRAVQYQKKALELGNRNALYTEACALIAAKKTEEGIEMLKRSCAAGLSSAIFKLGTLARDGVGMTADPKTGYELIRRGALGGDTDAMIAMAESAIHPGPHTPTTREACLFADMAEECNDPRAAPLREKLAALLAGHDDAPSESDAVRPL